MMDQPETTEPPSEPPLSSGGDDDGAGRERTPAIDLADPDGLLGPAEVASLRDIVTRALAAARPAAGGVDSGDSAEPSGPAAGSGVGPGGGPDVGPGGSRGIGLAGEVRLRVVGDEEMAAAHAEYLGVEGTTDVLTFDLSGGETAASGVLDVDIMLCADEAARQAERLGHERVHELALYAVHGVLHCLGYDDHDEEGFRAMHAEEDRVLEAAGLGPVFGAAIESALAEGDSGDGAGGAPAAGGEP